MSAIEDTKWMWGIEGEREHDQQKCNIELPAVFRHYPVMAPPHRYLQPRGLVLE